NALDDLQAGLVQDEAEIVNAYRQPGRDEWSAIVLPVLRALGVRKVQRRTQLSLSATSEVLTGKSTPRAGNRVIYLHVAAEHARSSLAELGVEAPMEPVACMSAFLRVRN